MTKNTQDKLIKKSTDCGYTVNFDKMKFMFIRFEGDNPEICLETYLEKKLHKIDMEAVYATSDLMNQWLQIIQLNARDKANTIETDLMCGTLFGKLLANISPKRMKDLIKLDYDPAYDDAINKLFIQYFNKNSQYFKIYSKIAYDFQTYLGKYSSSANDMYKNFVDFYCTVDTIPFYIKNLFETDKLNMDLALILFKLFTCYVCYKRETIRSIRSVFGYENN